MDLTDGETTLQRPVDATYDLVLSLSPEERQELTELVEHLKRRGSLFDHAGVYVSHCAFLNPWLTRLLGGAPATASPAVPPVRDHRPDGYDVFKPVSRPRSDHALAVAYWRRPENRAEAERLGFVSSDAAPHDDAGPETELSKLQRRKDELRAQGGDLHLTLGDDPGTAEEVAAVANAMLAYEPPSETAEQRHVRYCEAANQGVDIGPDRDFIEHLKRGVHLENDAVFLGVLGSEVPEEWQQLANEASDRLGVALDRKDWLEQMTETGWRVDPESGKTVNVIDPDAVWTGRP